MKTTHLVMMAVMALGAGAIATPASAAVGTPGGMQPALDDIAIVDTVQYVYHGRRYCWSDVGWHGPGWYRCGYHWRRGLGWGGPEGWLGWSFGGDFRGGHRFHHNRELRHGDRFGQGREFRRGDRFGQGREFRGNGNSRGTTGMNPQGRSFDRGAGGGVKMAPGGGSFGGRAGGAGPGGGAAAGGGGAGAAGGGEIKQSTGR
jgi:hypothetical protein